MLDISLLILVFAAILLSLITSIAICFRQVGFDDVFAHLAQWNTVLEHVIDVFERSTLELWNKSPTEDNGDNGDGTVDKSNLSTKVSVLCL
jgi:hypothetical protein